MTFNEYLNRSVQRYLDRLNTKDSERLGQAYWNALNEERPIMVSYIIGDPELDPYYKNGNLGRFLQWISERWDDATFN